MTTRKEYELSDEDLERLLNASKPVPYMIIGGVMPRTPQQNANDVWSDIGNKMGFKYLTVRPVPGKDLKFITAEPTEDDENDV